MHAQLRAVVDAPPDPRTAASASALASVQDADLASLPPYIHITYGLQRDGAEAATCAAEMRPHIQAANTRREADTPALTMQRCLHMRGASGHVRTV